MVDCASGAIKVRDDTNVVRRLLRGPRPVIALLASEFVAAVHPMTPEGLEHALLGLGFFAVETTLLGEEIVAEAYEKTHARSSLFVIRSTCAVAVEWVRRFYPQFASALAPIVPPYIAQARLSRELYSHDVAIVYVSPCFSRKDEAFDPQFRGAVDACIDFTELRRLLDETPGPEADGDPPVRRSQPRKEVSLTDGFPRQALESRTMLDAGVKVVRGLREADTLLSAIARGETAPEIIDLLNCEGCMDGPAVSPRMSLFAKRNIESAERERNDPGVVSTRKMLRYLPAVDVVRSFRPKPVRTRMVEVGAVEASLAEAGFTRENAPNCGACGYDTCLEQAVAVQQSMATWDTCLPLQRRLLAETSQRLAEVVESCANVPVAPSEPQNRIADEVARALDAGSLASLVLVRIDSLDAVGEANGHAVAEAVVSAVSDALAEDLRPTHLRMRLDDDLVLVLSGVDKTSAFALAERARERVLRVAVPLASVTTGYRQPGPAVTGLTLSMGVATAGHEIVDADALLAAARSALDTALEGGGDQVRLAAG